MTDMHAIASRLGRGAHARAGVLASVIQENPLLAGVAAVGFSVSFQTIAKLAGEHGLPGWPVLYPVGIDIGILAMFAEALHLIRERRSDFMPRLIEWALSAFTVYVNIHGSAAADWLGRGLHAVMPCLWVACLELVRHRRVGEARQHEPVPLRRWIASPLPSLRLWLRMQRDGIGAYVLALELEQARLHARDLVRAAPREHRAARSSLLRKRIRSGRLPETVRRAVRASLAGEYAPGWEESVTDWVMTALALPAHVAASLENARRATLEAAAPAAPEVTPGPPLPVTPEAASGHPAEVTSGQPSGRAGGSVPATSRARPKRKVPVTPRVISDADLKKLVEAEFDADPSVSVNAAAKNLGRSRDRVRPLLEEVRREAHVRPLERRKA